MASIRFIEHGPLIDGELELIRPEMRWVDALLAAAGHPDSLSDPGAAATTRNRVVDFVKASPKGHHPGDRSTGRVPSYSFWMRLHRVRPVVLTDHTLPRWGDAPPPVEIAGSIGLRVGNTFDLEMYLGHIGYNVYPPARGNHYAERSCRLLLGLARAHGMKRLWITCNPDNWASRRTCERLGCQLAQIISVPTNHPLYQRGDREKCRYWIDV